MTAACGRSGIRKGLGQIALAFLLAAPSVVAEAAAPDGRNLVEAARAIMIEARYASLTTLDAAGRARVRAMDPFSPEADLTVWLGTRRGSRKVADIRLESRVVLFYMVPDSGEYVSLSGTARIVDDADERKRRFKAEWEAFYPDPEESYLLIEVTPSRLEIVSEKRGILSSSETWGPPSVELPLGTAEPLP